MDRGKVVVYGDEMSEKAFEELMKFLNGYDFGNEWEDIARPMCKQAYLELAQLRTQLARAKRVIEQVKHDGDIFDHLRGFAGYIKAANYLVGED